MTARPPTSPKLTHQSQPPNHLSTHVDPVNMILGNYKSIHDKDDKLITENDCFEL
jgi:hypothetical protein